MVEKEGTLEEKAGSPTTPAPISAAIQLHGGGDGSREMPRNKFWLAFATLQIAFRVGA